MSMLGIYINPRTLLILLSTMYEGYTARGFPEAYGRQSVN